MMLVSFLGIRPLAIKPKSKITIVARTKSKKYQAIETLVNVLEPSKSFYQNVKNIWLSDVFKNSNPIILELGCGSGEYTLGMAKKYPENNYIGVDIKGDRLYKGANLAILQELPNVAFLRTQIENLAQFFLPNSVHSIWITFPDPQLENPRKQLTSSRFLEIYQNILAPNGLIQLKTDSQEFFEATTSSLKKFNIPAGVSTADLYNSEFLAQQNGIQTHYEAKYLKQNKSICFMTWNFK